MILCFTISVLKLWKEPRACVTSTLLGHLMYEAIAGFSFNSPFLRTWSKHDWLHMLPFFHAGAWEFLGSAFTKMDTLVCVHTCCLCWLKKVFILSDSFFTYRFFSSPGFESRATFPVSSWTSSSKYLSQCLLYLSEYGPWAIPHEKILEMVEIYVWASRYLSALWHIDLAEFIECVGMRYTAQQPHPRWCCLHVSNSAGVTQTWLFFVRVCLQIANGHQIARKDHQASEQLNDKTGLRYVTANQRWTQNTSKYL